jgi:hypothetical protein
VDSSPRVRTGVVQTLSLLTWYLRIHTISVKFFFFLVDKISKDQHAFAHFTLILFFCSLQVALGKSQQKNANAYSFDSELKDTDFRSRIVEGCKQPNPDFTVAMPGGK